MKNKHKIMEGAMITAAITFGGGICRVYVWDISGIL